MQMKSKNDAFFSAALINTWTLLVTFFEHDTWKAKQNLIRSVSVFGSVFIMHALGNVYCNSTGQRRYKNLYFQ